MFMALTDSSPSPKLSPVSNPSRPIPPHERPLSLRQAEQGRTTSSSPVSVGYWKPHHEPTSSPVWNLQHRPSEIYVGI